MCGVDMKNKREFKIKKSKSKYPQKSWLNPKIQIAPSLIHGKGMFAKEPIRKAEVVFIWGGPYITKREAEKAKASDKIIFQIDEDVFTFEERGEDITYFINHSCNPNIWMKDAVTFIARRSIKKGEELTIDVSMFESEKYVSKWKCLCEYSMCRKKITGKDWRLPDLQKRYGDHFSPLINKKIKRLNGRKI